MTTNLSDHSALHAKRFDGIVRPYTKADVDRLRGHVPDRAHESPGSAPAGSGSCCTARTTSRRWAR